MLKRTGVINWFICTVYYSTYSECMGQFCENTMVLFNGECREHLLCFCIVLPLPRCHVTGKLFLHSGFHGRLVFPHVQYHKIYSANQFVSNTWPNYQWISFNLQSRSSPSHVSAVTWNISHHSKATRFCKYVNVLSKLLKHKIKIQQIFGCQLKSIDMWFNLKV